MFHFLTKFFASLLREFTAREGGIIILVLQPPRRGGVLTEIELALGGAVEELQDYVHTLLCAVAAFKGVR